MAPLPKRLAEHWELVFDTPPARWDLERSYLAHRRGVEVSSRPSVLIAVPAYTPPDHAMRASLTLTIADLVDHGIQVSTTETKGDALVSRGRHYIVHHFLCSTATHLLQWDADVESCNPSAVRKMLESGCDVVGGAYPRRNGSGTVVANPLDDTVTTRRTQLSAAGMMPVAEVATGFLMTSRKVLIDLQQRHPELLYLSEYYVPMWALFDAALEVGSDGRRRYVGEDWHFCSLARNAGYDVNVYVPARFRHWGRFGHEGNIVDAWGLVESGAQS